MPKEGQNAPNVEIGCPILPIVNGQNMCRKHLKPLVSLNYERLLTKLVKKGSTAREKQVEEPSYLVTFRADESTHAKNSEPEFLGQSVITMSNPSKELESLNGGISMFDKLTTNQAEKKDSSMMISESMMEKETKHRTES